jgi:hypothetical protein
MAVEKITEPLSYRQATLKAFAGYWWSVEFFNFHGTLVPRGVFPWVVQVFNALVEHDSPKKMKRKAAKIALAAVQAML